VASSFQLNKAVVLSCSARATAMRVASLSAIG
jgi:hypothetical protein